MFLCVLDHISLKYSLPFRSGTDSQVEFFAMLDKKIEAVSIDIFVQSCRLGILYTLLEDQSRKNEATDSSPIQGSSAEFAV